MYQFRPCVIFSADRSLPKLVQVATCERRGLPGWKKKMMQRKPSLMYFPRGMYSSNTLVHTGDPPEFTSNPQDQFVFERDADGNPVTLTIMCPVTGSGPPNITWSARTMSSSHEPCTMY